MKMIRSILIPFLVILMLCMSIPLFAGQSVSAATTKNFVYDDAGLLTAKEKNNLNRLANQYADERQTEFIVYTTNNPNNKDVQILNEDLYDEKGFGYNQKFGDAVVLALDMRNRDIYLAGYGEAEYTLNSGKLERIRAHITEDLSYGNYESAFEKYIQLSAQYIIEEPESSSSDYSDYSDYSSGTTYDNYGDYSNGGVDSDNLFFKFWFQLLIAVVIGIVVVWIMLAGAGGRVTVNRSTYEDASNSGLLDQQDRYIRTTVVKTKIERNNSSSGGGGGGTSSGGNSHSGSRGSF